MPIPKVEQAPASMLRSSEGLGLWEHRGKVAAVGVGHSPTARRWDGKPETSVGAYAIIALRKAIEDAGVSPDQVDGLVMDRTTTTGAWWPEDTPVPQDVIDSFNPGVSPFDGLTQLSAEWILNNVPELTNVNFGMYSGGCMTNAICVAAQAVGDGLTNTCLVLKGWHNLPGRYYHGGANALDTIEGPGRYTTTWGVGAATNDAWTFTEYLQRYGQTHDKMAQFVVNEKRNGLLFPEGFFYQNRPEALTVEDYIAARWVVKPLNLYDHDLPIQVVAAYLFTTADRAKDMKQKPVYILNHATTRPKFYVRQTLDNAESSTSATARKLYEGAGITARDLDFENMYDGFTTFHNYFIEGLGFGGIKRGEALDFYQGDITIEGPNPVSPSGGNAGSGRTRFWMHTDSIQQLQGRAGERQVHLKNGRPEVGVSGGPMPQSGDFIIWSTSAD